MTQYRERLIKFIKTDLPSMRHDLNQATTTLSLQAWCVRMFGAFQVLLYEVVSSGTQPVQETAPVTAQPVPAPAPAAPPPLPSPPTFAPAAPPVLAPQTPPAASESRLPDLPDLPPLDNAAPASPTAQINGMPPVDLVPGVMNVVVTQSGPLEVKPTGEVVPVPPTA